MSNSWGFDEVPVSNRSHKAIDILNSVANTPLEDGSKKLEIKDQYTSIISSNIPNKKIYPTTINSPFP